MRKTTVANTEGIKDWKCLGDNATCNGCLAHREKCHANNRDWPMKKKMCHQIEVDCEVGGCKVKKNKWARHVKTEKHRKGVEGGRR